MPRLLTLAIGVACLAGCRAPGSAESPAGPTPGNVASGDAGIDGALATDASAPLEAGDLVTLTAAERAILETLSPAELPPPPPDISNRFADDPAAAALGQKLFYDPSFSGPLLDSDNSGGPQSLGMPGETGKVACAGCHIPKSGFSDTRSFQRQISLGAGWGRRRAPSILDVGQATLLAWDGSRDALYNQIFGPIESVVEMNSSRLYVAEVLFRKYQSEYEAIFGPMPPLADASQFPPLSADLTGCQPKNKTDPQPKCDGTFHGSPGDQAEYDSMTAANQVAVTRVVVNAGKAIGAFERLLPCGASPFDAWMHGDANAISQSAQRGAALFVGKAGCVSCHSGPFLSDQKFHNVGLAPERVQQAFVDANDPGAGGPAGGIAQSLASPLNTRSVFSDGDDGRLPASPAPNMLGAFRTPTLRCVSQRPTFMHTGQIYSLADVVTFFDRGGARSGFPGTSEIHPLALTEKERQEIVEFLESLNGPGPAATYLQ